MSEIKTKSYEIVCRAYFELPDGAEGEYSYDGRMIGFKLKDGSILKPWIVMEQQRPERDEYKDLKMTGLEKLGAWLEHGENEITERCAHVPHNPGVMQTVCETCGAEIVNDPQTDTWYTPQFNPS